MIAAGAEERAVADDCTCGYLERGKRSEHGPEIGEHRTSDRVVALRIAQRNCAQAIIEISVDTSARQLEVLRRHGVDYPWSGGAVRRADTFDQFEQSAIRIA